MASVQFQELSSLLCWFLFARPTTKRSREVFLALLQRLSSKKTASVEIGGTEKIFDGKWSLN
jgi:hypothetical protein